MGLVYLHYLIGQVDEYSYIEYNKHVMMSFAV